MHGDQKGLLLYLSMLHLSTTVIFACNCQIPFRQGSMEVIVELVARLALVLLLLLHAQGHEGLGDDDGSDVDGRLSYEFYQQSCPQLETIVNWGAARLFVQDPQAPSAFLRLLFHDCQGCDASILLETSSNTTSEMGSIKNLGVRGREAVGRIKSLVEAECPGTVSCADVLVLCAREAVAASGGPVIRVPLGRRDAFNARAERADASLPPATATVDAMLGMFAEKGLTAEESVAMMGGHTLGVSHCVNVQVNLGEDGGGRDTPVGKAGFESPLRRICQLLGGGHTFLPNDLTPVSFDNQYYRDLVAGRGLLRVDFEMATHPRTAALVRRYAVDLPGFFQAFASAFVKLASSDVLTGARGRILRTCDGY